MARFEREARTLASLNHPNIAQVYGFEDRALIMELLEGETLRDRLRNGALPVRKAIEYAVTDRAWPGRRARSRRSFTAI